MRSVRLALCQMNPVVGDLEGNCRAIIRHIGELSAASPDLIAFPELAVTGYPPEDLLLKPHFVDESIEALHEIARHVGDAIVMVGFVDRREALHNAAAVIHAGKIRDIYHKIHLPNYGVFDEARYFRPGDRYPVYEADGLRFGINICEDIWFADGPASAQARNGAQFIVNINASPYHKGKSGLRLSMLSERAQSNGVSIAYLNTVGGQDELVFDGHSLVLDDKGALLVEGRRFVEEVLMVDMPVGNARPGDAASCPPAAEVISLGHTIIPRSSGLKPLQSSAVGDAEEVYNALVLGTRDYMRKNGFRKVCIGLSGGVDSSLVAAVAVDALGPEQVTGVFMPSPFTSHESREDASELARQLAIPMLEIPISPVFSAYLELFAGPFKGLQPDATEENLQARIRGNILMALSNKFGWLVLTTGNKSEMSVGYATLYGDMAGGFAPIKDVPKTLVYEVCRWKNGVAGRAVVPERVLTKEPTAELRPDQKDTDSLPPYPILDPILKAYIEEDRSYEEIVGLGFDPDCVKRVVAMVDRSEYKRRQSPPGIKITPRAFGRDRRFPITNRYRSY